MEKTVLVVGSWRKSTPVEYPGVPVVDGTMLATTALLSLLLVTPASAPPKVLTLGVPSAFATHAPVEDLAFSPDGRDLAAIVHMGDHVAIDVYATATGQRRFRVGNLPHGARGRVVYAPAGDRLVALTYGKITVFDARTGALQRSFKLPRKWRSSVRVAEVSQDGAAVVWRPFQTSATVRVDLTTGNATPVSAPMLGARQTWPRVRADHHGWHEVGFAASGRYAVGSSKKGREIHVFDRSGRPVHQISSPREPFSGVVIAVDVSSDGQLVAVTGGSRLRVMRLSERRWRGVPTHLDLPTKVGISGDGRTIAVSDRIKGIQIFAADSGRRVGALVTEFNTRNLAMDAHGQQLLVFGGQGVTNYDARSGGALWKNNDFGDRFAVSGDRSTIAIARRMLRGRTPYVDVMAWTRSRPTPWVRHAVSNETGWNSDLALSHDGRRITASFGTTHRLYTWDLEGKGLKLLHRSSFKGRGGVFTTLPLPDRHHVLAGAPYRARVWLVPMAGGKRVKFPRRRSPVDFVVALDADRVAFADSLGDVQLWNTKTLKMERGWRAHADGVRGMAVSMDGRKLVTVGKDRSVVVWDVGSRVLSARTR